MATPGEARYLPRSMSLKRRDAGHRRIVEYPAHFDERMSDLAAV